MNRIVLALWHFLITLAKLVKPGGVTGLAAENLLLKHQLLIHRRSLKRSPKLKPADRFLFGFCTLFMKQSRITKAAIMVRHSTLLRFHKALIKHKYRLFYSSKPRRKPGPKGPSQELINAIVEMKRRNPRFGCPRIAEQINLAFGLEINKDVVRRILDRHCKPTSGGNGPSWMTFLGHMKDSLWSVNLFRCESILLKSHWLLVVMDLYTKRIVGFSVHRGDVDGATLCFMFNKIACAWRIVNFRYKSTKFTAEKLALVILKVHPYTLNT